MSLLLLLPLKAHRPRLKEDCLCWPLRSTQKTYTHTHMYSHSADLESASTSLAVARVWVGTSFKPHTTRSGSHPQPWYLLLHRKKCLWLSLSPPSRASYLMWLSIATFKNQLTFLCLNSLFCTYRYICLNSVILLIIHPKIQLHVDANVIFTHWFSGYSYLPLIPPAPCWNIYRLSNVLSFVCSLPLIWSS